MLDDGYSICLNEWALDSDIKNELGLLLIISSLCASGCCYASNKYLAKLFKIDEATLSRKLKKLVDKDYIKIDYTKQGNVVSKRMIRLTKMSTGKLQKSQRSVDKKVKENNTSIKITSIKNTYIDNNKKFIPPTLDEIKAYCLERNNNVDPQIFYDYFTTGNWQDSEGKPVRNWKQKIITWEKHNPKPTPKTETGEKYEMDF